jgi:superfamily I DNA and/or RNA helicase
VKLHAIVTNLAVIVESADKYQGSECDCVILTTTMEAADEKGNFGFAEDIKRINVALTRAKVK